MASRCRTSLVRNWMMAGALVAAGLAPASAGAEKILGVVEGHEHLENPVWKEAKDPENKGYTFREMVPTVPAKYRKLSPHIPKELCIAAFSLEDQPAQQPTLIRVGGGRTTPVTIVVTPGTKLVFENTDPFKHRLYIAEDTSFPPNDMDRGATREWTAQKVGTYEIRDELAPSLRMWVVAHPKVAAVTYPSMKGEFKLTAPKEGEYEVQAFFSGEKVGPSVIAAVSSRDVKLKKPLVVGTKKDDAKEDE